MDSADTVIVPGQRTDVVLTGHELTVGKIRQLIQRDCTGLVTA